MFLNTINSFSFKYTSNGRNWSAMELNARKQIVHSRVCYRYCLASLTRCKFSQVIGNPYANETGAFANCQQKVSHNGTTWEENELN